MTPKQRADIYERLEAMIERREKVAKRLNDSFDKIDDKEEIASLNSDVLELAQFLFIALPDPNESDHDEYWAFRDRQIREESEQDKRRGGSI